MIEIDVRQNTQGNLVVAHGKKQSRAADVLSLAAALKFINNQAKILLDVKEGGLADKIIDEIVKSPISQTVILCSLKLSIVKELESAVKPSNILLALSLDRFSSLFLNKEKLIQALNNHRINNLLLWHWAIRPSLLAKLRKNNCQVWGWTINSQRLIKKYSQMGVDGIITNYPDRASQP